MNSERKVHTQIFTAYYPPWQEHHGHGPSLTACEIHAVTTAAAAICKQSLQQKIRTVARNKNYELKGEKTTHMS